MAQLISQKNSSFCTYDTNILYIYKQFLKRHNRKINHDLKSIVEWLKPNKTSLNLSKTKLVLFRSKDKKIPKV